MSEILIQKSPSKKNSEDSDSSLFKDDSYYDIVLETLKHVHPRSKLKRHLAYILSTFYSCQLSLIFLSFIVGILILGIPLLLIYYNLISNIAIPFLIICIFCIIFSSLLIIIHIYDTKKNKSQLLVKWERKNIMKNSGSIFTLIILTISISIMISFFSKIIYYQNKEEIIIDYEESKLSKELISDFIFKYILIMIYFSPLSVNKNNENNKIRYYISNDEYLDNLRNKTISCIIPLLIICINKIIKCFLIQVKYTIEQIIFFLGSLILCLIIIIVNKHKYDEISNMNLKLVSFFENMTILIIYIGYISWILHSSFKLINIPKDKSFSIRKYNIINLLIILLFDLITCLGASFIFISIIYFYISTKSEEEIFKNLSTSFTFLRNGFLLIIIGNSYYFGHYLLSLIFRPISIQYTPYELKNKCYIKAKRNLINILNIRKNGLKLKDVLLNKKK